MTAALIASHETEIRGKWNMIGGKVEADDQCLRIEDLVTQHLREVGRDATGWDRLFIDPQDGRYWELTYPESELHGGGPPRLRNLQELEARAKYGQFGS
ncbi:MAG TPA: Imm27 family immunity protein [Candidatus Polarisedimenticolia bacterium]|nr:Imm27 family immunity protein [Candidatus Polarisedimenticolia bacterium]